MAPSHTLHALSHNLGCRTKMFRKLVGWACNPEKLSILLLLHGDRAKRVPNYNRTTNKSTTDRDTDTARPQGAASSYCFATSLSVSCKTAKMACKQKRYSQEDLKNAILAVQDGKSISSAAAEFCVPKSTLHGQISGMRKRIGSGAPTILQRSDEHSLARYWQTWGSVLQEIQ